MSIGLANCLTDVFQRVRNSYEHDYLTLSFAMSFKAVLGKAREA